MKTLKTIFATSAAIAFVFVLSSQDCHAQRGQSFQGVDDVIGVERGSGTVTPSMRRPSTRSTRTSDRGRTIGVATPQGQRGSAAPSRTNRSTSDRNPRTSDRGRSIGVAGPGGASSRGTYTERQRSKGYSDIRRRSSSRSSRTTRPNPNGATAQFF